jgi:tRNA wybutosine-synthesizing protein 1
MQMAKENNNVIQVNKEKIIVKSLPRKIKARSTKKTSNKTCDNDSSACCNGNGDDCCKNQLSKEETPYITTENESQKISIKIFYATQTRTAKYFAQQLYESFIKHPSSCECTITDIIDYETEDFLSESAICIFVVSTYNVEGPLDWFYKWLEDTRYDFRVDKQALSKMRFAVFGLGDSAYGDQFCIQPRNIDKWLGQLGAKRLYPLGEGDKNSGIIYIQLNIFILFPFFFY